MELLKIWIGLLGAVIALVLGCWLCQYLERKLPVKRFDERQQNDRGRAYRFGFWVGITYYFVIWIIMEANDLSGHGTTLVFAGIMLQLVAAFAYMLMTGSALPFSRKPTVTFVIYLFFGAVWLYNAYRGVAVQQNFFGVYSVPWLDLISSAAWFSIGVMQLISWLVRKRDE